MIERTKKSKLDYHDKSRNKSDTKHKDKSDTKHKDNSKKKSEGIYVQPFGMEEIEKLTMEQKLEVLMADDMITALIMKTNLNPELTIYHNTYYPDEDSDDGYILTEDCWLKKNIDLIANEMMKNKYRDLMKIYDELKGNLETSARAKIGYKLAVLKKSIDK